MKQRGCFEYGGRVIDYSVTRTERKRLAITVHPDLAVTVVAPHERTPVEIDQRVRRRASWIVTQLAELEAYLPKQPPRQYVSGESHYYLGRQYRLKVEHSKSPWVKLGGKYIHVGTPTPNDADVVAQVLGDWYRGRGRQHFERIVQECLPRLAKHGIKPAPLRIQKMKRRWGSFTPGGRIILNPDLIKTPTVCIEYVVIHELCHTKFPHHGKKFEALLTRCLPDWRERKKRLESFS